MTKVNITKNIIIDALRFVKTGHSDHLVCTLQHFEINVPKFLLKFCGKTN